MVSVLLSMLAEADLEPCDRQMLRSLHACVRVCALVGVPEEMLLVRLNEHGAHAFLPLDAEAFTLLYFDVFGTLDNYRKKNKSHAPAASDGHHHLLLDGGHSGKKGKDCLIS
jgi:hypothetical protein